MVHIWWTFPGDVDPLSLRVADIDRQDHAQFTANGKSGLFPFREPVNPGNFTA